MPPKPSHYFNIHPRPHFDHARHEAFVVSKRSSSDNSYPIAAFGLQTAMN